ncbi:hypothetical protein P5P86_02010 [Nocardioides sp. BP30]|uniref:glycosyl-4,4'-diaponeurosporenoate acyltransferase CrtO family protein n=1 Tax=Nocardioides sp. BP30 TaxID=3036374 RepID=UPI00246841B3|nr:hypothetical protein [Nocardioides sp. BP30]WGL52609.1 hypothetical protein P5P86_02010 [Nocardioides sp. BP30]
MLRLLMPEAVTVAVDVLAWGAFHSLTGLAAHRLGAARLAHDGQLLRIRRFEEGGGWYRRRLHIHRWKDRLPEAGGLFGGVSKRHLPTYDVEGLALFARETRRAELAHLWAMACGPLFVLWNPPLASALLIAYGVLVNLPFIVIQRYNRARIQALATRVVR